MTDKDKSTKEQFPDMKIDIKADSPGDSRDTRSRELNEKELEGVSGGATISKAELIKLQKKC
ncbi:MAG: bacteriocin [Propionivibrio sp.]|uniref:Bacteriocin n=1 Tax=Candidatus Propionivibrio dominans TaxID=2954373 RepID=A0A9D7FC59_9RHOO|nr:bacteriocin [Candidatus Propionivibrio dominans]